MGQDESLEERLRNLPPPEELVKEIIKQYFLINKSINGNKLKGVLPIITHKEVSEQEREETIVKIKKWLNEIDDGKTKI